MGQHQVSGHSRASWYPVITASSYKVAVLMCLINYVAHQYTNAAHNTPHKTNPGEGLQSDLFFMFFFLFLIFFQDLNSLLQCHLVMLLAVCASSDACFDTEPLVDLLCQDFLLLSMGF